MPSTRSSETRVTLPFERLLLLCGCVLSAGASLAQERAAPQTILDFKKLSVQELMDIEVMSVSKTPESLVGAPAAVTVLSSEEIRRSGATTVPEALRELPGIYVARQTSNTWAIGSRGFGSVNSEKLLVLSDTRSIYTPLFSGVFWDVQDYLLQDIDRIEVIRGPGATLWGSNAVDGVINITTKSARDTQGLYLETSTGTEEHGSVGARFGGRIGDRGYYRVFGKYFDRDATFNTNRVSSDDWNTGHLGFRSDWQAGERDTLTVQGDAYRAEIGRLSPSVVVTGRPGPAGPLRVVAGGGNVLARWRHKTARGSEIEARVYYDRTHRNDPSFVDDLDTVDVDLQDRFAPTPRHEVTWSLNYRSTANRNRGRGVFAVDPPSSNDQLAGGFIQDQIQLLKSIRVTVGTKLEHNDFSGAELQPSGRFAWSLPSNQTLWAAVSRAVRVPTRLERDIAIDVTNPQGNPVVRLLGNPGFDAEQLLAYEAGYRWQALKSLSVDVALFLDRYRGLAALERGSPVFDAAITRTVIPVRNQNLNSGRGLGGEAFVTYAVLARSRVSASYSNLDMDVRAGGMDINRGVFLDGSTPRHQFGLRSSTDLPRQFQADVLFRHIGSLRRLPSIVTGEGIPAYSELDLRLAWNGLKKAEIALVGQNLLHSHHPEFGAPDARGEIERGAYVRIAWGF
jgi:iron complex outermembrane receptor protein